MSQPLQFEYHPDADQICAFVENALPAHEREQMLDHLAACTECRAVVALSLPHIQDPVDTPALPRLTPWWFGWRLAWPAGLSVAALVLTVFYIHQATVVQQTPALPQIAEGRMAASPAPARQSSAPAASQPAKSAPTQQALTRRSTSNFDAGVATPRKAEVTTNSEPNGALAIQSRNSVVLDKLPPPAPAPPAALPGQIAGTAAGAGGSRGNVPTGSAGALFQNATPVLQAKKLDAPEVPSTTPNPIALSGRNTQTVTVDNAAPAIQTESVDMSTFALSENEAQVARFIQLKHPLPSGLPALSAAMQARRIVAIDAQNGIFLSEDAGKHWKAIHPRWQGRAVRVERVGFAGYSAGLNLGRAPEPLALKAVGAAPAPNPSPSQVAAGRSLAVASGASLTGTVTDMTGAVIQGTSVSVIDSATHTVHTVISDKAGHYLVDGLAPGTYTVEARARGFASLRVADVAVTSNRQNVANLSLQVGAATQAVTVNADFIDLLTGAADQKASAKAKKQAAHDAATTVPPVFAIITDNGERWTSADGVTWERP